MMWAVACVLPRVDTMCCKSRRAFRPPPSAPTTPVHAPVVTRPPAMASHATRLAKCRSARELLAQLRASRGASGGVVVPQHKAEAARCIARLTKERRGSAVFDVANDAHCRDMIACVGLCVGMEDPAAPPAAATYDVWEGLGAVVTPEDTVDVLRAVTSTARVSFAPPPLLYTKLEETLLRVYASCEPSVLGEGVHAFLSCRHQPKDLLLRALPAFVDEDALGGLDEPGMLRILEAYQRVDLADAAASAAAVFAAFGRELLLRAGAWSVGVRRESAPSSQKHARQAAERVRYGLLRVYAKYLREAGATVTAARAPVASEATRDVCERVMAALGRAIGSDVTVDAVQAFTSLGRTPPQELVTAAVGAAPRGYLLHLCETLGGGGGEYGTPIPAALLKRALSERAASVDRLAHHAAVYVEAVLRQDQQGRRDTTVLAWVAEAMLPVVAPEVHELSVAAAAAVARVLCACDWDVSRTGGDTDTTFSALADRMVVLVASGIIGNARTQSAFAAYLTRHYTARGHPRPGSTAARPVGDPAEGIADHKLAGIPAAKRVPARVVVVLQAPQRDLDAKAVRNILDFCVLAARADTAFAPMLSDAMVEALLAKRIEGVDVHMVVAALCTLLRAGQRGHAEAVYDAYYPRAEEVGVVDIDVLLGVLREVPGGDLAEAAVDSIDMRIAREGFNGVHPSNIVTIVTEACHRLKLTNVEHLVLLWTEHAFRHGFHGFTTRQLCWALWCAAPVGPAIHPLIDAVTLPEGAPLALPHVLRRRHVVESLLTACMRSGYDSMPLRERIYGVVCADKGAYNMALVAKVFQYFGDERQW